MEKLAQIADQMRKKREEEKAYGELKWITMRLEEALTEGKYSIRYNLPSICRDIVENKLRDSGFRVVAFPPAFVEGVCIWDYNCIIELEE
jgi:hypothetical protein